MTTFIFVILNSPVGANVGPTLTLTADVGVVTPSTATVTELLAGLLVEIDVLATTVTVTSNGVCVNSTVLPVPTTTTTTTLACHCISFVYPDGGGAGESNISYIDCDSILVEDVIYEGDAAYEVCGTSPTADNIEVLITEGGPCADIKCLYFVSSASSATNITYTDCYGVVHSEIIPQSELLVVNYCGTNPTSDLPSTIIIEGEPCGSSKTPCGCNCYEIYNPGPTIISFTYVECRTVPTVKKVYRTRTLGVGTSIVICAAPGTITVPNGVTIADLGTNCANEGACLIP